MKDLYKLGQKHGRQVAEFIGKLATESERAAVVLGVARLNNALEKYLKSILKPNQEGSDPLFDMERPLGIFSSKINLAYRIGIIDEDFEHALHMIRKIRNEFAHSVETESLSERRHSDRLKESIKAAKKSNLWKSIQAKLPSDTIDTEQFMNFCILIALLITIIEVMSELSTRIKLNILATFDSNQFKAILNDYKKSEEAP